MRTINAAIRRAFTATDKGVHHMSITEALPAPIRAAALWAGHGLPAGAKRLWVEVIAWHEAHRARAMARSLDDRTLRDIGLSRADIEQACDSLRDWRR